MLDNLQLSSLDPLLQLKPVHTPTYRCTYVHRELSFSDQLTNRVQNKYHYQKVESVNQLNVRSPTAYPPIEPLLLLDTINELSDHASRRLIIHNLLESSTSNFTLIFNDLFHGSRGSISSISILGKKLRPICVCVDNITAKFWLTTTQI